MNPARNLNGPTTRSHEVSGQRPSESGVAMIMVLAVLLALTVLAVPFMTIAIHENRASEGPLARARAQAVAEGYLRYGTYMLESGHRANEILRAAQNAAGAGGDVGFVHDTPDTDSPEEAEVPVDLKNKKGEALTDSEGIAILHRKDPRGVTADLRVRDEQAYPNLLSAPPFLIAASLGRSVLAADITDTDAEIPVEDASSFPAKNGVLNIEGEVISYAERQGGRFTGCQRGGSGGLKARKHTADAFVFDDRAREIAMLPYRSPRAEVQGGWREPFLPTYVKEIVLFGRDALDPLEVDRIESHFSVLGRREVAGGFGEKTTVRVAIDPEQDDGTGFPIQVTSTEGFNSGTVVRITDGVNTDYGIVILARSQGMFGGGFGQIRLAEAPRNAYEAGRTYVQSLLRHPVNINSAPRSVLYRIIDGIRFSPLGRPPRGAEGRVSGEAAAVCVEGILAARPIRDFKHFREVLEGLVKANQFIFTSPLAEGVFRNAVDANDVLLYHSTVPFCFESSDHYTLDASAVVNDGSGRELARKMIRQRVHVSPSGWLDQRLDSQADFEGPLFRGRSGKYVATLPHPTARWVGPTQMPESRIPRMFWRFTGASLEDMLGAQAPKPDDQQEDEDQTFDKGVFAHTTEGHVQLLPGRMSSGGYNKHFDGPTNLTPEPDTPLHLIDANGWKLKRPYRIDPRDRFGGFGGGQQSMQFQSRTRNVQGAPMAPPGQTVTVQVDVAGPGGGGGGGGGRGGGRGPQRQNSGALMGRMTPNPLRFDMWWFTGSGAAGRQVLFDLVGDNADEDRIQLVREADGTLQGRVHDRTIDNTLDNLEEHAFVRWEPEVPGFWKANTWYHLGLAYRGTKPDDVMLFVDGFKRGKGRFQTTLSGSITKDDANFNVEDAEGWPDQGVAMIGSECVAFENRSGNNFDVVQRPGVNPPWGRGQRGTWNRGHAAGEPVTLFGYSSIPRTNTGQSGVAIPAGGATLRDSLSTWCVATFESNATETVTIGQPPIALTFQIAVHDPSRQGGNILTLASSSLNPDDYAAFPESGGYIVIASLDLGNIGGPVGGIEFARYQSRAGNRLLGLQSGVNPPNKGLEAYTGGSGPWSLSLTRLKHAVRLTGSGSNPFLNVTLSAVFPVSIPVSDVSGYKEPEKAQNPSRFTNPGLTWDTDPEFVQVGEPNTDNIEANRIEWIRYNHIDKDGSHLLCDEANYILGGGRALQGRLGGPSIEGIHGGTNGLKNWVPFRGQGGTEGLANGRISGGCDVVPCVRTESHGHESAINTDPPYNLSSNQYAAPGRGQYWSSAGFGDSVTIEGQNGRDRKSATVAWAGLDGEPVIPLSIPGGPPGQPPQTVTVFRSSAYDGHGWIAFTESLGTEYRQRALPRDGITNARTNYVRILKFPSGELPDIGRNPRAFAGGDAEGNVASQDGYIDELRVTPFEPQLYVLWNHNDLDFGTQPTASVNPKAVIDATVDEIPICNAEWVICNPYPRPDSDPRYYILADGRKINYDEELRNLPGNDAGLVRIGEEVIAFRGIGRGQGGGPVLLDCQRGYLGTMPTRHGYGENVAFLDFMGVSKLQGAIDGAAPSLPVANVSGFFQTGGTLLVDQEMIHYTEIVNGTLAMPWRLNDQGETEGGLFRGRYGTAPRPHDAGALVLEMPFRYWDRYAPRQDSAELAYYAFSLDLPGAYFHDLQIDKYRPAEHVDVEVLCRTDPEVPWTAEPGKAAGLFRFEDASEKSPASIRRAGRGLDVRVMFKYSSGAFEPDLLSAHDWKATPELRSIGVRYLDETRVLGREDVR